MVRETTWVLALFMTCAPALGAVASPQQRPASAPAQPVAGKDSRDKAPSSAPKPEERERWKWWLYDRAELGITDQQSTSINQIFESTIAKLRETRQELDRSEEELSRTIKEHKADIAAVSGLLDRLESARSQHNKTRTLMLYRMHLVLSAEQRTKLEALRARQEANRRDREPPPGFRRHP